MICCVTFFYKKKLSKPIKLLTNAYHKIEANDLDFTLSYPLNDEMGKLCHAFEKMKDCLSKNNETMFRQFAEQRRLNAAFSHDLRTPLTLLKGHATMLLSFIPKGLVSQEEILDEISVMSKNISRLEKYVIALYEERQLYTVDKYFQDEEAEPSYQMAGKEITPKLLLEAIRALPEERRKIVLMYYFEGLTDVEIGKQLNISRSTVQYRRTSSFEQLKKYLEENADEWIEW